MDTVPQSQTCDRPEPTLQQLDDGRWNACDVGRITVVRPTREEAISAYYAYEPPAPSSPPKAWEPTRKRENRRTVQFESTGADPPWYIVHDLTPDGAQYDQGAGDWAPPINRSDDNRLLDLLGVSGDAKRILVKIHGGSISFPGKRESRRNWRRYRVALIGVESELDDPNRDWTNGHTSMVAYIRRVGWAGSPLYIEALGATEPRQVSYRGFEELLPKPPKRQELDRLEAGFALLRPLVTGQPGRPKGSRTFRSKADVLDLVNEHKRPRRKLTWTMLAGLGGTTPKTLRQARRDFGVPDDVLD